MTDLLLQYRACGAECREDWLRMLAHDNGLPIAAVQAVAERLGEREDFRELVHVCEDCLWRVRPEAALEDDGLSRLQMTRFDSTMTHRAMLDKRKSARHCLKNSVYPGVYSGVRG